MRCHGPRSVWCANDAMRGGGRQPSTGDRWGRINFGDGVGQARAERGTGGDPGDKDSWIVVRIVSKLGGFILALYPELASAPPALFCPGLTVEGGVPFAFTSGNACKGVKLPQLDRR